MHRDIIQFNSKYRGSGYTIINSCNKFYILKDRRPVKWQDGFSSVKAAIQFMEGHSYITATIDSIDWSQEDLDWIVDAYQFNQMSDTLYIAKLDDIKFSLTADKENQQISLAIEHDGIVDVKEFANFDKVIELLDRYYEDDEIVASVCSDGEYIYARRNNNRQFNNNKSNRKSSRDIASNLVRVRSSNIWAYGMDIKDRKDKTGTLVIQFKGTNGGPGDIYLYYDVPVKLWREFISAPSKGHFMWMNIRNNFWYSKLTGDKKGKLKNAINR